MLANVHEADNSYLPGSVPRIGIEQELLVLLWKSLEEVRTFLSTAGVARMRQTRLSSPDQGGGYR